jgi:hypothetical protein
LGGIYCTGGFPIIANNTITANGIGAGGSSTRFGGGVAIVSCDPSTGITGNTIADNEGNNGAGVYCSATAATILRNDISNNVVQTGEGGGIELENSMSAVISRNVVRGNNGGDHGGGVTLHSSDVTIVNNLFVGNYVTGLTGGGGVQARESSPVIVNNTFVDNRATAGRGGAILLRSSGHGLIINNIFYKNKAKYWDQPSNPLSSGHSVACGEGGVTASVSFCDAFSDLSATSSYHYKQVPSTDNCIFVDPLFVDEAEQDYHLQLPPSGLATPIDKGHNPGVAPYDTVPLCDLERKLRPVDDTVVPNAGTEFADMGAYETQ